MTPINIDLASEDFTVTARWLKVGGVAGSVYEFMGTTGNLDDLTKVDYTDYDYWKLVPESHIVRKASTSRPPTPPPSASSWC